MNLLKAVWYNSKHIHTYVLNSLTQPKYALNFVPYFHQKGQNGH